MGKKLPALLSVSVFLVSISFFLSDVESFNKHCEELTNTDTVPSTGSGLVAAVHHRGQDRRDAVGAWVPTAGPRIPE